MGKLLKIICFSAGMFLCVNAWSAEKLKEPTVEYSADMVMETVMGPVNSKIYYALGGKQRMETNTMGSTQIVISRLDKQVGWVLMPAQKTYMETSFQESAQQSGANVNDCDVDMSSLGSETVNGVRATKNKVSMSCPEDAKYNGTIWVTDEGIMVKLDAVVAQGSNQMPVKIDLMNLKIAKQDPSLFEIPAGYEKFDMGSISSMFGAAQEQAAQAQAQAAREQAASEAAAAAETSGTETGRDYTAQGRAYTASETANPADNAANKANETMDTTDKVKGTINRLKGLFGK